MLKTRRNNRHQRSITLMLFCFASTFFAYGLPTADDRIWFDINWWKQTIPSEQEGFILGYLDCSRPHMVMSISIPDYRDYVDNIMEPKHGSHPKYVTEAIAQGWLTLKPSAPKLRGESDPLNGLSWTDDAWNRGYVEGFMQCYSIAVSKSLVDLYNNDIDHHYASANRVNDPLADVLKELLLKRKISPRDHY